MIIQISNVLFMGSLGLLVITLIFKGLFRRGFTGFRVDENAGSTTDLHLNHDHKEVIATQDSLLNNILKSSLVWISILGTYFNRNNIIGMI